MVFCFTLSLRIGLEPHAKKLCVCGAVKRRIILLSAMCLVEWWQCSSPQGTLISSDILAQKPRSRSKGSDSVSACTGLTVRGGSGREAGSSFTIALKAAAEPPLSRERPTECWTGLVITESSSTEPVTHGPPGASVATSKEAALQRKMLLVFTWSPPAVCLLPQCASEGTAPPCLQEVCVPVQRVHGSHRSEMSRRFLRLLVFEVLDQDRDA